MASNKLLFAEAPLIPGIIKEMGEFIICTSSQYDPFAYLNIFSQEYLRNQTVEEVGDSMYVLKNQSSYCVKIYCIKGSVTPQECLDYLRLKNSLLAGLRGLLLLWEYREDQIPITGKLLSFNTNNDQLAPHVPCLTLLKATRGIKSFGYLDSSSMIHSGGDYFFFGFHEIPQREK